MKNMFRTQKKFFAIIAFMLLACSILFIKGCGSSETAKQNWKITALSSTLGAPSSLAAYNCYSTVKFLVTNPDGNATQGIVVDIQSGPFGTMVGVAQVPPDPTCNNALTHGTSAMSISTDDNGIVALEFRVVPTDAGQVFFIDASSGAAAGAELVTAASTST